MHTRPVSCLVKIVCMITGLLSVGYSVAEQPPATVAIRGEVVSDDGKPVSEARVFSVQYDPDAVDYVVSRVMTGDSGRFTFDTLPAKSRLRFYVQREGFSIGSAQLVTSTSAEKEPFRIVLRPAGKFLLNVVDPAGRPLAGATLSEIDWDGPNGHISLSRRLAERMKFQWPRSNESGKLDCSLVPTKAEAAGYVCHSEFARAAFKTTASDTPREASSIQMNDAVKLTLRVTGMTLRTPKMGYALSMFRQGDDTSYFDDEPIAFSPDGVYQTVVPPGHYASLILRKAGIQVLPRHMEAFEIPPGKESIIDLSLTPRGKVSGRVVHAISKQPLAEQQIEAYVYSHQHQQDNHQVGPGWHYSARATTDALGEYTLQPGVGAVRLFLGRSDKYISAEPLITVDNVTSDAPIRAVDLLALDFPKLRGVVTTLDGTPVPGAVLQPVGKQFYAHAGVSNSKGHFEYQLEELSRDKITDPNGFIEMWIFDPARPLGRRMKIPIDLRDPTTEVNITLEQEPITPPPVSAAAGDNADSMIGKQAPELAFQQSYNVETGELRLANYRGKFVLLHYWATWCGPCLRELPQIEIANDSYSKYGLVVIGVHHNSVPAETVKNFIQAKGPRHATVLDSQDGTTCNRYGVKSFPTLFLIDPAGNVVFSSHENSRELRFELISIVRRFLNASGRFESPSSPAR